MVINLIFYMDKNGKCINHKCVINGDTYKSIAAASILAKVNRDNYINNLCTNILS